MWKTIQSGQVWHGEFRNRKKNGDIYWESSSISPVCNENGLITSFVAVKEDITEKRQTHTRITEALKFNQAILATSPIGIIIYKATGQCIQANPAAGNILGATPDQLTSQNFNDLKAWKDYGIYSMAMKAIEEGKPVSSELFYISTFGKEIWMDVICGIGTDFLDFTVTATPTSTAGIRRACTFRSNQSKQSTQLARTIF